MHDEIQRFRTEIASVVSDIAQLPGKLLKNAPIEERIRQCFVTWSHLKTDLEAFGADPTKVGQVDAFLENAARSAGKRIHKNIVREKLRNANKLLGDIFTDVVRIEPLIRLPKAFEQKVFEEISDLPDELIPKAILGWKTKIKEFLQKHPFDQNVFVMVRYSDKSKKLLDQISAAIAEVSDAREKKLFPVIARNHSLTDDLYNPIACLLTCRYGIAIFDKVEGLPRFNPNIAYELGMMHLLQRKCLILKSAALRTMPADILQKLYMDFSNNEDAVDQVKAWFIKHSRE